jgi:hypothetical protein
MMLTSLKCRQFILRISVVCFSMLGAATYERANSQNVDRPEGSWASAMYCAFNVQSQNKLERFLEVPRHEKILPSQADDKLEPLEKNESFGKFFRVERRSLNAIRVQEVAYENGKKTNKTNEFLVFWGTAKIVDKKKYSDARFCFVSLDHDGHLDLKGIPSNSFSKYLSIISSIKLLDSDKYSIEGIPHDWMLAVHSTKFKKLLKGAKP